MKSNSLQLITREHVNGAQLNALLQTFSVLSGYLLNDRDEDGTKGGLADGGARMAVENSVVKICDRLDSILQDKERWSMDAQQTLEGSLTEAYKQNAEASKAQAAAYVDSISPHRQYEPKLMKLPNGDWVAYLGDLCDLNNAILGMGASPAQAIAAFDGMFSGHIPDSLVKYLAERETQQNEKQNVDQSGNQPTEETPRKRKNKPRNRSGDEQDPESGGADGGAPRPAGS